MSDTAPEVCSCLAPRQAARHVTQFYDAGLVKSGLGLNQLTLGHLMRPLLKRRLVTLAMDAQDRRSRRVSLAAAGQALLAKARPMWAEAERRFSRTMGDGAARQLRKTLKRVATTDFTSR